MERAKDDPFLFFSNDNVAAAPYNGDASPRAQDAAPHNRHTHQNEDSSWVAAAAAANLGMTDSFLDLESCILFDNEKTEYLLEDMLPAVPADRVEHDVATAADGAPCPSVPHHVTKHPVLQAANNHDNNVDDDEVSNMSMDDFPFMMDESGMAGYNHGTGGAVKNHTQVSLPAAPNNNIAEQIADNTKYYSSEQGNHQASTLFFQKGGSKSTASTNPTTQSWEGSSSVSKGDAITGILGCKITERMPEESFLHFVAGTVDANQNILDNLRFRVLIRQYFQGRLQDRAFYDRVREKCKVKGEVLGLLAYIRKETGKEVCVWVRQSVDKEAEEQAKVHKNKTNAKRQPRPRIKNSDWRNARFINVASGDEHFEDLAYKLSSPLRVELNKLLTRTTVSVSDLSLNVDEASVIKGVCERIEEDQVYVSSFFTLLQEEEPNPTANMYLVKQIVSKWLQAKKNNKGKRFDFWIDAAKIPESYRDIVSNEKAFQNGQGNETPVPSKRPRTDEQPLASDRHQNQNESSPQELEAARRFMETFDEKFFEDCECILVYHNMPHPQAFLLDHPLWLKNKRTQIRAILFCTHQLGYAGYAYDSASAFGYIAQHTIEWKPVRPDYTVGQYWWDRRPDSSLIDLVDRDFALLKHYQTKISNMLQSHGGRVALVEYGTTSSRATRIARQYVCHWITLGEGKCFYIWIDARNKDTLRRSYLAAIEQVACGKTRYLVENLTGFSNLQSVADGLMSILLLKQQLCVYARRHKWLMVFANVPSRYGDESFCQNFFSRQSNWYNSTGRFIFTASQGVYVETPDKPNGKKVPVILVRDGVSQGSDSDDGGRGDNDDAKDNHNDDENPFLSDKGGNTNSPRGDHSKPTPKSKFNGASSSRRVESGEDRFKRDCSTASTDEVALGSMEEFQDEFSPTIQPPPDPAAARWEPALQPPLPALEIDDGTDTASLSDQQNGNGRQANNRRFLKKSFLNCLFLVNTLTAMFVLSYGFGYEAINDGAVMPANGGNPGAPPGALPTAPPTSEVRWDQVGGDMRRLSFSPSSPSSFGWSVSIDAFGRVVAIGDPWANDVGKVFTFRFNELEDGGTWEIFGSEVLEGDEFGSEFGNSTDLSDSGKHLAVGARNHNHGKGQVKVFRLFDETWLPQGEPLQGDSPNDNFGSAVSISSDGTRLAASAPLKDAQATGEDTGEVRVYEFDERERKWIPLGQSLTGLYAYEKFGFSIQLASRGDVVAIGAPFRHKVGTKNGEYEWRGAVDVYKYLSAEGLWVPMGKSIEGISAAERVGWSVDLSASGNTIVVGAPTNTINGEASGQMRVYEFNFMISDWEIRGNSIQGQDLGGWFGNTVSLNSDGTKVAAALWCDRIGILECEFGVRMFDYHYGARDWRQIGSDLPGRTRYDPISTSVAMATGDTILMTLVELASGETVVQAYKPK